MDALVIKVREHARTVGVHALIAVGVNADGGREVLGLDIASDQGCATGCTRCCWDWSPDTAASPAR
jgi:transposase-like protein